MFLIPPPIPNPICGIFPQVGLHCTSLSNLPCNVHAPFSIREGRRHCFFSAKHRNGSWEVPEDSASSESCPTRSSGSFRTEESQLCGAPQPGSLLSNKCKFLTGLNVYLIPHSSLEPFISSLIQIKPRQWLEAGEGCYFGENSF